MIGPDHYNSFFNELMPPFCIGTQATSVGDFRMPRGPLNVDGDTALALATHLMDHDFDVAVSRRMQVDHGFTQTLSLIWGSLESPPLVPIFMNAVAQPGVPRVRRCRALGEAIGTYLDTLPGRTLLIGSGGLSHEPPVPTLEHPDAAVRERITVRSPSSPEDFDLRMQRVLAAGQAMAAGNSPLKPLNPAWDARWMDALQSGQLNTLEAIDEASIARDAGLSGHESKTWLVARAALPRSGLTCALRWYRDIPALIAGFGILFMHTTTSSPS
jgi:2,3-dihydroxyphenylpropionate 1,2-dioxygenase